MLEIVRADSGCHRLLRQFPPQPVHAEGEEEEAPASASASVPRTTSRPRVNRSEMDSIVAVTLISLTLVAYWHSMRREDGPGEKGILRGQAQICMPLVPDDSATGS